MFWVRPSRINGMKGTIHSFPPKKSYVGRTLSESYGMDSTVNYMRGDGMSVIPFKRSSMRVPVYEIFENHIHTFFRNSSCSIEAGYRNEYLLSTGPSQNGVMMKPHLI